MNGVIVRRFALKLAVDLSAYGLRKLSSVQLAILEFHAFLIFTACRMRGGYSRVDVDVMNVSLS